MVALLWLHRVQKCKTQARSFYQTSLATMPSAHVHNVFQYFHNTILWHSKSFSILFYSSKIFLCKKKQSSSHACPLEHHTTSFSLSPASWLSTSSHCASIPAILCSMNISQNIMQGGPLPKRDIVDTKTHASCAIGPNIAKQSRSQTSWGKAERAKAERLVRHKNLVIVTSLWCTLNG